MAIRLLGQLRRKRLLFFFEIIELHLEQLLMVQGFVQGANELRTQAFLPHFEGRLKSLSASFQIPELRIGESIHKHNLRRHRG